MLWKIWLREGTLDGSSASPGLPAGHQGRRRDAAPRIPQLRGRGSKPSSIVLDAGPLIALSHEGDRDHAAARSAFAALVDARSRLVAPLPIVFEVYKWLLYKTGAAAAQNALAEMRSALDIVCPTNRDVDDTSTLVATLGSAWRGSLEDALVAVVAIRLDAPAWTLNYRDLSAFPRLQLWNP
jgi:predicted nucleic acid-binding protein